MVPVPPLRVVRAATAVRTALQSLTRRMVPPEVELLELVSGFMATHTLYAAARLAIADLLAAGPVTADEVATRIGSDPDCTHRLLRACASFGLFREDGDGRFTLTRLGHTLRSDTPGSMVPVVLMLGDPQYQGPWSRLEACVRTGAPAAQSVLGAPMLEYLDQNPGFAATFDDAMTRLTALDWPTVEAVYDFTPYSTIVDVGGGHGQLLALMLGAAPSAAGVLLERDTVADGAAQLLRAAGVLSRCRIDRGSFFETCPSDGDLYVLRRVIHDFDDAHALAILTTVRRHMPPDATLLLMESVVPAGNGPHFAKTLDLDMMAFVGGRERTEAQFGALLDDAGFRMAPVVATASTLSLLEATLTR